MKRKILITGTFILASALFVINGCKKDDTTGPVISINGSNPYSLTLGHPYSDAGATANDDNDGSVNVTTSGVASVDTTTEGSYPVTYTATDKAGNTSTATRTVNVVIARENYVWANFSAYDSSYHMGAFGYNGTIAASGSLSDGIVISQFSGTTSTCSATVSGHNITIPPQTVGIFNIYGSGTINNKATKIFLTYYATQGVNPQDTIVSVWTKL